jgi:ABC-type nitrate/sulfonate/bicarbonate transport system permease component
MKGSKPSHARTVIPESHSRTALAGASWFTVLQGLLFPVAIVLAWELFARHGSLPYYLSSPTAVAWSLYDLAVSGELWGHLFDSLFRAFLGFLLGGFFGVLAGLLAGTSKPVERFYDPLISLTYPVPKIVVLPIIVVLLGMGHASKFTMIMISVFYPLFINTFYGTKSINKLFIWSARNMGAGKGRIFFMVVLPSTLPQILAGARVGLALSLIVLFATELFGSRSGLGYLIIVAEDNVRFDLMFASITVIGLLGFLSDRLLVWVRRRLLLGQMLGKEEGRG